MNSVDNILGAINLASYENDKELAISLDDLLILRSTIIQLRDKISLKEREIIKLESAAIFNARKNLRSLDIYKENQCSIT